MSNFIRVMELYDAATKIKNQERPLYLLLKYQEKVVGPLFDEDVGYFHKAFRQIDVTSSGELDAAIWHLLDQASTFWECVAKVMTKDQGEKADEDPR